MQLFYVYCLCLSYCLGLSGAGVFGLARTYQFSLLFMFMFIIYVSFGMSFAGAFGLAQACRLFQFSLVGPVRVCLAPLGRTSFLFCVCVIITIQGLCVRVWPPAVISLVYQVFW